MTPRTGNMTVSGRTSAFESERGKVCNRCFLVLCTRANNHRTGPSRPVAPKQTYCRWTANRLGALGGEPLVAVRFFVDLDQGGAAASGARLALPSTVRRAQQCCHRSE